MLRSQTDDCCKNTRAYNPTNWPIGQKKFAPSRFRVFLCCTIKNSPYNKNIFSAQNRSKYVAHVSVDDVYPVSTGSYRAVPAKTLKKHSALRTNSKSLMVSFVRIGHLDHLPSCDKKIYIYVNPKLGAKNCKW